MTSHGQNFRDGRQERPRISKPQQQGSQQNIKPDSQKPVSELRRERGDDWDPFGKRRESGMLSRVVAFFRGENEYEPSSNNRRRRANSVSSDTKLVRRKTASPIRLFERLIAHFLQNEKIAPLERRHSAKSSRVRTPERSSSQRSKRPTTPGHRADHHHSSQKHDKKPLQRPEVRARSSSLPNRSTHKSALASEIKRKPWNYYDTMENKVDGLTVKRSNALRHDQVEVRNHSVHKHRPHYGDIGMVSNIDDSSEGKSRSEHSASLRSRDANTSRSTRRQPKAPEMSENQISRQASDYLRSAAYSRPDKSKSHSRHTPPPVGYTYDEPSVYSQMGRTKSFYADDAGYQFRLSRDEPLLPPMQTVWNDFGAGTSGAHAGRRGGSSNVHHAPTDRSGWTYDWGTDRNIFSRLPSHGAGSPLEGESRNGSGALDQIYSAFADSKSYLALEIENSTTINEAAERRAELDRLEKMMDDFLEKVLHKQT